MREPVQQSVKRGILAVLVWCASAAYAVESEPPPFERYQIILNRKPFGEPPPEPAPDPAARQVPPGESFAKHLRLSALIEVEGAGEGMRVGLIDLQTKESFMLRVGESMNGVELVSADYEAEEAVLRKGGEMALLKSESGEITPLSGAEAAAAGQAPSRRPSYIERRQARTRHMNRPAPEPKYTGDELQRHLEQYQMEVIRKGLPPLPIPLTPEMDQQLVNEGVLPPL
jgi:hypothetical protein